MNDKYPILDRIKEKAHIQGLEAYHELYKKSITDPYTFWKEKALEFLNWEKPFTQVKKVDWLSGEISWFGDGEINVCYNCVDRHLETRAEKTAILWEGDEPGDIKKITYRELHENVSRLANVLKERGVKKGDRVAIYMPMIPVAAMAMLACARIGAVHSVVFAGFSAESLSSRILDSDCQVVITADEGLRGSKKIPLKNTVDEALKSCPNVHTVLMSGRTGAKVTLQPDRDVMLEKAMEQASTECPCEPMASEDLLFLLYTSGSTGKPKGLAHSSAGYLLYTAITHKYIFDYHEEDVYACMADIGWITGHSYIVYGPLCNGATTVMFESIPTYPDSGRYWDMVERHQINQFYTAPTAIRAIASEGDHWVKKYDRSSLRVMGSVGEPINPEAWKWYYHVAGNEQAAIVDTWWQTETGGIMITPLPGVTENKPGSATRPFFGVEPVLLDEQGKEIQGNGVSGILAIKSSWPGQARTIYGDKERFLDTYYRPFPGYYFTGDGCTRDDDGYYWITGRVDDVINVSGHRLGTAEVESALTIHTNCAEAAVVGIPHDVKGQGLFAYVVLSENSTETENLVAELKQQVKKQIGGIAVPEIILIVPGLPKTRSGKIMRRILRKIATNEFNALGDISTLGDPGIVEKIIQVKKTV